MKSLKFSILSILLAQVLVSCSFEQIQKTAEFRSLNHYSTNSVFGSNSVLSLTLIVTFASGPFSMIDLPVPTYNSYSDYRSIVTAKQEGGLFGPGETDEAVSIRLQVMKAMGGETYTLYSRSEGTGPSGSSVSGYWSSGGKFLVTFDNLHGTIAKEEKLE